MNRTVPIINTSRVSLRPMRPEDFDRYAEIWADPEVTALIRGPLTRAQSWDTFLRNAGHWQMAGFGQWAIWEARSRHMVGQTGFFYRNRDLGEDFDVHPEAGWVLAREAQGQGLAHDAAHAAHEWFDRVVHGPLVAVIDQTHDRSLKLAESLGYAQMRTTQMENAPVVLLKRLGPPPK
jgi:RimJ/RimL family protein N-acetyltransferase